MSKKKTARPDGVTERQLHAIAVNLIDTGFLVLLDLVSDGSPAHSLAARRTINRYGDTLNENRMHEPESQEA